VERRTREVRFLVVTLVVFCLCAAVGCKKEETEEQKALDVAQVTADALIEELEELGQGKPITKHALVKQNMQTVMLALEDFSTMAEGRYPAERSQTTGDVIVATGGRAATTANQSIDSLLPSDFRNPYEERFPALTLGSRTPPDWTLKNLGQVIWVPQKVSAPVHDTLGKIAEGYRLYGIAPSGPLNLVLSPE